MKFLDYKIEKKTYYDPENNAANPNGVVETWFALDENEKEVYSAPTKRELLEIIRRNYGRI